MTQWLASNNIAFKGHPIIWENPPEIPTWMANLSATDQRAAALQRIDNVLTQFPQITRWDLVNEITHLPNTWLGNPSVATWETAITEARKIDSDRSICS